MACKICETRRPRRFCPGVGGDICAVCCGTEREVTVNCPLDCEYLHDARAFEKTPEPDVKEFPNADVRITPSFLERNSLLVGYLAHLLFQGAMRVPGAVDYDVRDALDSLTRTYRTLESGLYYETKPANPLAAAIHEHMQAGIQDLRDKAAAQAGMTQIRDAEILGVLVWLQRLEITQNNGRRRGRAFLSDLLGMSQSFAPAPEQPTGGPSRLVP